MNFLELCQEVAEESGTVANIPSFTTTVGATGRLAKVVRWVRNAWRDIQNERPDWLFMRKSFAKALVINQTEYTGAGWSLEVARWLGDTGGRRTVTIYDPAIGTSDEGEISQIPYDRWRSQYDRGDHDADRPSYWAIAPNGSLVVGPKPDKAYIIRGEYISRPVTLELDTDTPDMPEQFHGLIVAEALRLMARGDEAFDVLAEKAQRYEQLRGPLVRDQVPIPHEMWGGTLG